MNHQLSGKLIPMKCSPANLMSKSDRLRHEYMTIIMKYEMQNNRDRLTIHVFCVNDDGNATHTGKNRAQSGGVPSISCLSTWMCLNVTRFFAHNYRC